MKVLHLVAGNLSGGAARGAYWLHMAQREMGVDSTLLFNGPKVFGDATVISIADTALKRLKFAVISGLGILPILLYRQRQGAIFNTGFSGIDFTKYPVYRASDIIHLHWINGLVAMHTLHKIDKPIVWTLRDMWPLSGGCHYAMDCERYKIGCGNCPQLGSQSKFDLSWLVSSNKRIWLPKQLHLVGISKWLSDCANSSRVFDTFHVETIANNIDTRQFRPISRDASREALGLPKSKRIVLLGAQKIIDLYKGFELFTSALRETVMCDFHYVFFGEADDQAFTKLGIEYTSLGILSDTVSLCLAYSAADVFIAPSRMEAFGKTLAEALACGTPVVCFDATGPADVVEHLVTGYKAEPFDTLDLARGIQWVLSRDPIEYRMLSDKARERATTLFDSRVIAQQYLDLYQRLL